MVWSVVLIVEGHLPFRILVAVLMFFCRLRHVKWTTIVFVGLSQMENWSPCPYTGEGGTAADFVPHGPLWGGGRGGPPLLFSSFSSFIVLSSDVLAINNLSMVRLSKILTRIRDLFV